MTWSIMCHFQCTNGEYPIDALEMAPPEIGTLFFFEGEDDGYQVVDVQYQLRRGNQKREERHTLLIANVLLERILDRTWTPPNT